MTKYDNIPGFPGYYINKRGGLWSNRKNGQWKKLKPHLNKMWNRYQCTLRDSRGIRKTVYLPNPENLPIVMHPDNNPANDYYRNLKWGTQKENIKQCLSDGRLFKNEVFLSRQQKPDYDDVNYFLEKLIADGEHHIKLLKEAMGMDKATKGVTVIIK